MTDEIVFYHNPRSRSQMVHWILEEAGAPYRVVPIDFEKGENKTPEGTKVFDDYVARLSARPAAQRTSGG